MYISIPGSPIVRPFDVQTSLIILQFSYSAQYRNRVMGESYLFSCVTYFENEICLAVLCENLVFLCIYVGNITMTNSVTLAIFLSTGY